MKPHSLKGAIRQLYFPVLAILAALLLGAVIIQLLGFDAVLAIASLVSGSFGGLGAIAETINKAIPVILTGLSYAIAMRCGIINLGAEGQLYMGTLCATLAGTGFAGLPAAVHLPLTLLAGFMGGALYGLLVGLMKNLFGASELITTIMLNYIAIAFCSFMISGPIKDLSGTSNFPQSHQVLESARLPRVLPGTRLHAGVLIALAALVFYYVFLWRTKKGYEMRAIGLNRTAAQTAGMRIPTTSLLAIFIAGGFAGLGGTVELLGVQLRLVNNFSVNFGFDGVAVALLGGNNAVGIGLSGILFGALRSGANKMQMMTGVPIAVIYIIQSFIILFVIGRKLFDFSRYARKKPGPKAAAVKEDTP